MRKFYTEDDFKKIRGKKIYIKNCVVDGTELEGLYTITDFMKTRVARGTYDRPLKSYQGKVIYLEEENWWIPFTSDYIDLENNKQLELPF